MKYYRIIKVTKPGQKNLNTKFNPKMLLSSGNGPAAAAKKAMSRLCRKTTKKIKGICTLTIKIEEVKNKTVNGEKTIVPVVDNDNVPIRYQYTLKREKIDDGNVVTFNGNTNVKFGYKPVIVESFNRVL